MERNKEQELIGRLRNAVNKNKCGCDNVGEKRTTRREIPITTRNECTCQEKDEKCHCCGCVYDEDNYLKLEDMRKVEIENKYLYPEDDTFKNQGILLLDEEGYAYEFNTKLTGFTINKDNAVGTVFTLDYLFYATDVVRQDINTLEIVPVVEFYNYIDHNIFNHITLAKNAMVKNVEYTYRDDKKVRCSIIIIKKNSDEK